MTHEHRFEEGPMERPWAVATCGRLLLLEGLGLLALAWMNAPRATAPGFADLWLPGLLGLMGLFGLAVGLRVLRRRAAARDQAMLLQGGMLALGLALYWGARPGFVFELLGAAVFLVLYLQHPDVRASFPDDLMSEEGREAMGGGQ